MFTLPSIKPVCKLKLTAGEGARVRRTTLAHFTTTGTTHKHSETCLLCLTNLGDIIVLNLPELRRQLNAAVIRREDIKLVTPCQLYLCYDKCYESNSNRYLLFVGFLFSSLQFIVGFIYCNLIFFVYNFSVDNISRYKLNSNSPVFKTFDFSQGLFNHILYVFGKFKPKEIVTYVINVFSLAGLIYYLVWFQFSVVFIFARYETEYVKYKYLHWLRQRFPMFYSLIHFTAKLYIIPSLFFYFWE